MFILVENTFTKKLGADRIKGLLDSIWCLLSSFSLSYKVSIKVYVKLNRITLRQGCTRTGGHVARPTKFCTVAPNICRSSVWKLLHSTTLTPSILRSFYIFGTFVYPCPTVTDEEHKLRNS
jgi:hypothetical protein